MDGAEFFRILLLMELEKYPVYGELVSNIRTDYTDRFAVLTFILNALLSSL
jgi:hypothetical protein